MLLRPNTAAAKMAALRGAARGILPLGLLALSFVHQAEVSPALHVFEVPLGCVVPVLVMRLYLEITNAKHADAAAAVRGS